MVREGIVSAYKFIQKLWNLNSKILQEIDKNHQDNNSNELDIYTNKFLKKITDNLENFSYNKIIANLHEMYSFLSKEINNVYKKDNLILNYKKILIAMSPIIPHFSNECLEMIKTKKVEWPKYDQKKIKEDTVNIVVQINGKKRGLMETQINIPEKILMEKIYQDEKLKKYMGDKPIKKTIFIKDKIINIIV